MSTTTDTLAARPRRSSDTYASLYVSPRHADVRATASPVPGLVFQFGPAAPAEPSRTRLTRRGRLAVTLLALIAAVGLFVLTGPASVAGDPGASPELAEIVVEPGQTLWQLASAALPAADPREAVQRVRELNALAPTDAIVPGQALLVPVS